MWKTSWRTASLAWRGLVWLLIIGLVCPWPLLRAEEMTPQKEKELGRRFHLKVAATGAIIDDPIINKYYKAITGRIIRAAGLGPGQCSFYILRSDGINAFAVPGGFVYMHTETINSLENEGELAAIIGHEVAHLTARHFARRVEGAAGASLTAIASMLAGALLASRGGSTAALGQALMFGGTGATIQSMLANSREDEAEADAKGRQYMIKAGYDARDMYGAFKIMSQKTYQISPDIPTYLNTHPALASRLAITFKDYENAPSPAPDQRYLAFRDRVLAFSGEPRRIQTIMTGRLNQNKNDASALHALGLLAVRQQNLGEADKLMSQALALSPGNPEYLADLGDLSLKRRKPQEAKNYYEKAGQDHRQAVLGLARACELLNDKKRAAALYDRAVNMETETYPEALELAGRFFGNNGQKSKGHFYLAKYFADIGNLDQAIFHYGEVVKLAEAGNYKNMAMRETRLLKEIKEAK